MTANQSAAANRRPAGQLEGSDNLSAIVAADRAFPAAVAELGRWAMNFTQKPFSLILAVALMTGCASLLPPAPRDCYTDAEARKSACAAVSVVTRDAPLTADEICTRLGLDRKRLYEHTTGGINMGVWETFSLSPHYELWLLGATQLPRGTYVRAFVTLRDPRWRWEGPTRSKICE